MKASLLHLCPAAELGSALQRAYLVAEDPTAPNFWHNVAQHVSGKTAQECQNRLWAAHPTPKGSKGGNPGAYALAAEADSDNSPLMPPPRKNAAGNHQMIDTHKGERKPFLRLRDWVVLTSKQTENAYIGLIRIGGFMPDLCC